MDGDGEEGVILRRQKRKEEPVADEATGLFLFDQVADALAAERVLKASGYRLALVAPPHRLRAGCDLAIAVARVEQVGAERALSEAGVPTRGWVDDPGSSTRPTELVTAVDFGNHLMVRAGNMKITVEKATRTIVNTSGGGCPDIPYLNVELVGKRLDEAVRPKDLGYTLCGLMLDRAYVEACSLLGVDVR
ncbi:MAG: DUF3343 domain-containing protein [Coriobacteriia bacterium]|nr:DUF3343 domain-containing protein [Coriobacteriia bacterium]